MVLIISPLRYPGGKNRLLPILLPLLTREEPASFADLFVGGGSVLLAVGRALPDAQLIANDLHPDVASFWKTVSTDASPLIDRIRGSSTPTVESFRGWRDSYPVDGADRAFKFLFLNRCSFSGIGVNPIGGWGQKSKYTVDVRWNPARLVQQIQECSTILKGRTQVTQDDVLQAPWADRVYLDPPYIEQGSALYDPRNFQELDLGGQGLHERLAGYLRQKTGWVLSYDAAASDLYAWASVKSVAASYSISGQGRQEWNGNGEELVITP